MTIGADAKLKVGSATGHPIDALFTGAARQWRAATAALLLSGSGNDGTAGLISVTECSGARLVQSPADAPAKSILRHAILNDDPEQILLLHEIAPALDALFLRRAAA
jgi:chemotaxis response regulator CheB